MSIKEQPLLLFDLGNVIMEFVGFVEIQRLWKPDMALDDLRSKWLSSRSVVAFERGQMNPQSYAEKFIEEWDLPVSADEYLDLFISWAKPPFPGSHELLERLSKSHELACLSNTNESHWNKIRDNFGIAQFFSHRFVSHEMGMVKPDAEIYKAVLRKLERPANEVIFFDDAPENIATALTIGIDAHLVCGIDAVKEKCAELGLL